MRSGFPNNRARTRVRLSLSPVHRPLTVACLAGIALLLSAPGVAAAQERLVGTRSSAIGPVVEQWSFGDGVLQPSISGDNVRITGARAISVPLGVSIPMGRRMTFALSAAYMTGTVTLDGRDEPLDTDSYTIQGLTDVRLRASTQIVEDKLVLTVGFNAPTGKIELDAEEFSALRVLAAPALGFQTPVLGTGAGVTAGLVAARELGGWAWAAGASYERRTEYAPLSLTGGLATEFNPGDVIHLSLTGDGLVGQGAMTLGLSADLFSADRLGIDGTGEGGASDTKLGPIFTFDWQLQLAAPRFRELTLYAIDRYRTAYSRNDVAVEGSSGNYLDAGVRSVLPLSRALGLLTQLNARHQSGLASDNTLASAATAGAALTLGLVSQGRSGFTLHPFVRGQYARISSGTSDGSGTGLAAGLTAGLRF